MAGTSFNLDISKFAGQLQVLKTAIEKGGHTAIDRGGAVMKASIMKAAPVGKSDPGYVDPRHPQYSIPPHTGGQLRRSVTQFPAASTGPGLWQVEVGPTVKYARFREFGGRITPKGAFHVSAGGAASKHTRVASLRFSIGGRVVFARSVNQAGSFYMTRGVKTSSAPVRASFVATFDEVIKGVTG